MTVAFGAMAADAQARGHASHGSCCCAAPATAQAAAEPQSTAQAPQGTRSFSYEPSTAVTNGTTRMQSRGPSWGVRGAASKILGNY